MMNKGLVALGIGAAVIGGVVLVSKKAGAKEIQLKEGWNEYRYQGPAIRGGDLLASINDYVLIAYYLWEETESWLSITDYLWIQPGYLLNIKVSQDCVWSF